MDSGLPYWACLEWSTNEECDSLTAVRSEAAQPSLEENPVEKVNVTFVDFKINDILCNYAYVSSVGM